MINNFLIKIIFLATVGIASIALFYSGTIYALKNDYEITSNESEADSDKVYKKGEWKDFVLNDNYRNYSSDGHKDNEFFEMEGYIKFNLVYGNSRFLKSKYKSSDIDRATSSLVVDGVQPENEMKFILKGDAGNRVTYYIDHDSEREENKNYYKVQYKAKNDDEVLQNFEAGDIDIVINKSKYAIYNSDTTKALGINSNFKKGDLEINAFASIIKGDSEREFFRGRSSSQNVNLNEYQYIKQAYYQLEPFKRYDNLTAAPVISSANDSYNSLIAFSSITADPQNYKPYSVNVTEGSLELYLDDQNSYNNSGAYQLTSIDNGYYNKLQSGIDYSFNNSTGVITFLKNISSRSRIFAVYTLKDYGTISSDPSARTDIFPGKIFVFIKYGDSIIEDTDFDYVQDNDKNGDGTINYDIYEIRSYYFLGDENLEDGTVVLSFYSEKDLLTSTEIQSLGKYSVISESGLVLFNFREPYKNLLSSDDALKIYSENQVQNIYNYSAYSIGAGYSQNSREFNLKHANIISGSLSVKINNQKINDSFYSVDYESGTLVFIDDKTPVINDDSLIEINYEYSETGAYSKTFIGGVRADYLLNNNLKIGGTVLYKSENKGESIPDVGSEPVTNVVVEGDATLNISDEKITGLVNRITGKNYSSVPVEVNGYLEYAKSYLFTNEFGKAMIDDMEPSGDYLSINLSEKEWQLSSLPGSLGQDQRGRLLYKYYRDPDSPGDLMGESFIFYDIDYSTKPGPYNIADSHYSGEKRTDDTNYSLSFDMDFSYGDYVSTVTRKLTDDSIDLSGLQYVELWYRAASGSGNVNISFDFGSFSEDADGDNILDTEDVNFNGELDSDPSEDIFEDIGFLFNPTGETSARIGSGPRLNSTTKGDGRLNSEDLNRNGLLDLVEDFFTCPGTNASIPGNLPSESTLQVDLSDHSWKEVRIYLNRSNLTDSEIDLLKAVEAVRINFQNVSASTGRIYFDSLRLVYSRWNDIRINDISTEDPGKVATTMVDTYNDSEYNTYSFVSQKRSEYESLYGSMDSDEIDAEKEGALEISYDLLSTENASVLKNFSKKLDLQNYDTFNLWLNLRELTSGSAMGIKIGTSEDDYLSYSFNLPSSGSWQKISFKLNQDSNGSVNYSTTGYPDLKDITYISIEIPGGSTGRIWINNIYASDPKTLTDTAWWAESEIKITKPFYKTESGTPVGSDFNFKYINRGHGADFVSPGKPNDETSESSQELISNIQILPQWRNELSYVRSKADSGKYNSDYSGLLKGETTTDTFLWDTKYISTANGVPSIFINYKQDFIENSQGEYINPDRIEKRTERKVYSPKVIIEEKVSDFFSGNLLVRADIDLLFEEEEINRIGDNGTVITNSGVVLSEKYGLQKNSLNLNFDYKNSYFYVRPEYSIYSSEIVDYQGKSSYSDDSILSEVDYGFHFPFDYRDGEYKLVERKNQFNFKWGFLTSLVSPEQTIKFQYNELNFRDYTSSEFSNFQQFKRSRSANSFIENGISIPFNVSVFGKGSFVREINLNFNRKTTLSEDEIPLESESTSQYKEEYGIRRSFGLQDETLLNLFKYPPWYFFEGRSNFANGRDQVNNTNNKRFSVNNREYELYDNSLMQEDNISLNSYLEFKPMTVNLSTTIVQKSQRLNIETAPQQNVNYSMTCNLSFDLMNIFNSGFFRENKEGISYHGAAVEVGFSFMRLMMITSNIREDNYTPTFGFSIQNNKTKLNFTSGIDLKFRKNVEYIDTGSGRSAEDDIYYDMLPDTLIDEKDRSYFFTINYEMELTWLGGFIKNYYDIFLNPMFFISYEFKLNRYDYDYSVSPEPYDLHYVKSEMTLDLHKNIKGGINGLLALEKYRNRETNGINREILSYQVGFSLSIVF